MNTWKQQSIRNVAEWPDIGLAMSLLLVILWGLSIGVLGLNSMYSDPGQFSGIRYAVTGAVAFIILFFNGFQIGPIWPKGMVMTLLWFTFSFGSLMSALVNQDGLLGEVWQMWGVPVILFFAFPRFACRKSCSVLAWSLVLGTMPYIVVSLVNYPLATSYFKGVFNNANTMGTVLAVLSVGTFTLLRGWVTYINLSLFEKGCFLTLAVCNFFIGLLILFSSSRTSLIAFLVLCIIFIGSLLTDSESRIRYLGSWLLGIVLLGIGISVAFFGITQGSTLSEMILGKFSAAPGITILSGREDIWKQIISEATLLGHGNDYFTAHIGRLPHNSYLSVLGAKGMMACVALFSFHVIALVLAIRYSVLGVEHNGYAIGPLLIVVLYIINGMTENVGGILGDGLHFAFLTAVGIFINNFHIGSQPAAKKEKCS